ncbi:MAG: hypothetical protein ACLUQ6_09935 [Alistipes onderdonkii]
MTYRTNPQDGRTGVAAGVRLHALADRQRQRRHRPGDGQRAGRPCHCSTG